VLLTKAASSVVAFLARAAEHRRAAQQGMQMRTTHTNRQTGVPATDGIWLMALRRNRWPLVTASLTVFVPPSFCSSHCRQLPESERWMVDSVKIT
jgi:hypothetical protein